MLLTQYAKINSINDSSDYNSNCSYSHTNSGINNSSNNNNSSGSSINDGINISSNSYSRSDSTIVIVLTTTTTTTTMTIVNGTNLIKPSNNNNTETMEDALENPYNKTISCIGDRNATYTLYSNFSCTIVPFSQTEIIIECYNEDSSILTSTESLECNIGYSMKYSLTILQTTSTDDDISSSSKSSIKNSSHTNNK
ncbi:hypothetical protein ACTFIW_008089 [Dictyostelium discoideum]